MPPRTLGLLSDVHHDPLRRPRRWINDYDAEGLAGRVDAALRWFADEDVDLIVVAGDVVEEPDARAFDEILPALTAPGLPVAAVGGNHDTDAAGLAGEKAAEHGVAWLDGAGDLVGVGVSRAEAGFRGELRGSGGIVVSHFPLIGQRERLAAAGLPYPGDLANRAELLADVAAGGEPVVVLSGHIHTRVSATEGAVLQLGSGALIEPPFDAAVVRVSADAASVEKVVRRLGPRAERDPVLAPERETWTWTGDGWRAAHAV